MGRKKAKGGDHLINLNTGEIEIARFVDNNGSAVVGETFPVFSDSPVLICWEEDEYEVYIESK